MQNTELFVDVILPVPVRQLFTYSVPELLHSECISGKRVVVQFGKKKIYSALIHNVHQNKPKTFELKEIIDIIDGEPIVNEKQIQFWQWMCEYYMCSIGEVYKAALPSGLRLESSTSISYHEDFFENIPDSRFTDFSANESRILDALSANKILTINEISSISNVRNILPVIKSLYEKGSIRVEESLEKGFQSKKEKFIQLSKEFASEQKLNDLLNALSRAGKQLEMLQSFLILSEYEEGKELQLIGKKELLEKSAISVSVLESLIKKEILLNVEREISRLEFSSNTGDSFFELNDHQNQAYEKIIDLLKEKETVLLHGVTSSGKTEIYIKLIKQYLDEGKQILYLLPEIALTSQIVERLRNAFGEKVGVYHSKYNDAERVETWNNISEHHKTINSPSYKIILGVRSSVFLPFTNLGLIVIDEEHENTYKQHNPAPRYQARDAALLLARIHGAKCLLGSATPSLESYFNSKTGKYGYVRLDQRYLNIKMPEIIIADVKEARRKKQMKSHFTPILLDYISKALLQKEQIILFQNRRGFAIYIECFECGWIPKCEHCDVSLTYHRQTSQLVCHYCGFSYTNPHLCPNCKCSDIRTKGFGTEKIEDELKIYFQDAIIKRMDIDSARGKKAHSQLISDIENQKVDIIVGTQMISKGLDFGNVSLVGILDANQMLNYPDFRAYERSYQLMAQVGGRAGRKSKRGTVIIQTTSPENQIIHQVLYNDYENMFKIQAEERKAFKYPPFCKIISITLKHKDKSTLDKASDFFSSMLRKSLRDQVIGPEYPIISKTFDLYLKSIMVKIENVRLANSYKKIILESELQMLSLVQFKTVQVVFDVDPY